MRTEEEIFNSIKEGINKFLEKMKKKYYDKKFIFTESKSIAIIDSLVLDSTSELESIRAISILYSNVCEDIGEDGTKEFDGLYEYP